MPPILHVLVYLRDMKGLLVREEQIRLYLRATVSPAPTGTEVSQALNTIERAQWAVSIRDEITGDIKWRITEAGKAEAAARAL